MALSIAKVFIALCLNATLAARIAVTSRSVKAADAATSQCSDPVKFNLQPIKDLKRKLFRAKGNKGVLIATESNSDVTYADVQNFEEAAWKHTERWEEFQRNRPYSVAPYRSKAPEVGSVAPDGEVISMDGSSSTLLTQLKALAFSRGSTVAAVLFGSMTCPVWRGWAAYDLHTAVMKRGVPVLHVYTMEAHSADQFPHDANAKGPLAMNEQLNQTVTLQDRINAAKQGRQHLANEIGGEGGADIPMVIDNIDGSLEAAFESRPFRLYVIDTHTSTVLHKTGLAPFNLDAKMRDLKSFLSGYCGRS